LTLFLAYVIFIKVNMPKNQNSGKRKRKYEAKIKIGEAQENYE
jgi:hypothetical protein